MEMTHADTRNGTDSLAYRIRLVRIAHVYYIHKDIDKAKRFLTNFGFQELQDTGTPGTTYYRGYGVEPFVYCAKAGDADAFGGAAFVVESKADLEYAARILPHATDIYDLDDAKVPGGGFCVTFKDPIDEYPFHLVWGQRPAEGMKSLPELPFNYVRVSPDPIVLHQC